MRYGDCFVRLCRLRYDNAHNLNTLGSHLIKEVSLRGSAVWRRRSNLPKQTMYQFPTNAFFVSIICTNRYVRFLLLFLMDQSCF